VSLRFGRGEKAAGGESHIDGRRGNKSAVVAVVNSPNWPVDTPEIAVIYGFMTHRQTRTADSTCENEFPFASKWLTVASIMNAHNRQHCTSLNQITN
jgi:hypothetical protein